MRERKVGPSAPLPTDTRREVAEAARLTPQALTAVLTDYRNGGSADPLQRALEYLVWNKYYAFNPKPNMNAESIQGSLYMGFGTAIERLRNNDVSAKQVIKFVTDELNRSVKDYGREISENILVPSSTNATRKKRGRLNILNCEDGGQVTKKKDGCRMNNQSRN